MIYVNIINSGPKTITGMELGYMHFFIDDTETGVFTCSPLTIKSGESTNCYYPASTGTHEVEIRGLTFGNIETGTVVCS
jgi:hypothetical protein